MAGLHLILSFMFMIIFAQSVAGSILKSSSQIATLVSTKKIWDAAPHAAFTDLVRYKDKWYCVFRESDEHVWGEDGVIRLLASDDGEEWETVAVFSDKGIARISHTISSEGGQDVASALPSIAREHCQTDKARAIEGKDGVTDCPDLPRECEKCGIDLRDPKLSITPDNRLMLLVGGTQYSKEGTYITSQPRVAFSDDAVHWSPFTKVLEPHEWLWRITWHKGMAYGVAYRSTNLESEDSDWIATLYTSQDGIHFTKVKRLDVTSRPSEATVRFLDTDEMVVLIRRGGVPNAHAWIGRSAYPYQEWSWSDSGTHLGGPNFLILPDQRMFASGRVFRKDQNGEVEEKTILGNMTLERITHLLDLPSGGEDCSYPGMVFHDGLLWISYYSSHEEEKASIYLTKVRLQ